MADIIDVQGEELHAGMRSERHSNEVLPKNQSAFMWKGLSLSMKYPLLTEVTGLQMIIWNMQLSLTAPTIIIYRK